MSHLEDDDLLKTQTPGAAGLIAGRYKVIRELGRGGMGEVFLVQDAVSGVQFALKRIPEDLVRSSAEMEDIRATYSLVCNLSHPHIANYKHLERDPESGSYYLIMEYVDGLSLDRWIKKNGPMTESQALKMLSGLASALDFAHSHRVIHRDVKASNIIVYGDCEAKLIDFGLAAQIKSSLTRRSVLDPGEQVKGTRPYMAPELWRGKKAMESADQWALAATIYEAVTGDPPWLSDDMAILGACITNDEPDRPEGISDALWVALERGLAKDPGQRWANCGEFARAAEGQIKVPRTVKPKPSALAMSSAEVDRLADELAKSESEARARAAREAREKKEKEEVARRQAELEEQICQEQAKRRAAEADAAAEKKRREAEQARAEAAERRRQQEDAQQGASLEIDADKGRRKRSWPVVVSVAAVAIVVAIGVAIWWLLVALPRQEDLASCDFARQHRTEVAWREYLQAYPHGQCYQEAQAEIDRMMEADARDRQEEQRAKAARDADDARKVQQAKLEADRLVAAQQAEAERVAKVALLEEHVLSMIEVLWVGSATVRGDSGFAGKGEISLVIHKYERGKLVVGVDIDDALPRTSGSGLVLKGSVLSSGEVSLDGEIREEGVTGKLTMRLRYEHSARRLNGELEYDFQAFAGDGPDAHFSGKGKVSLGLMNPDG